MPQMNVHENIEKEKKNSNYIVCIPVVILPSIGLVVRKEPTIRGWCNDCSISSFRSSQNVRKEAMANYWIIYKRMNKNGVILWVKTINIFTFWNLCYAIPFSIRRAQAPSDVYKNEDKNKLNEIISS